MLNEAWAVRSLVATWSGYGPGAVPAGMVTSTNRCVPLAAMLVAGNGPRTLAPERFLPLISRRSETPPGSAIQSGGSTFVMTGGYANPRHPKNAIVSNRCAPARGLVPTAPPIFGKKTRGKLDLTPR